MKTTIKIFRFANEGDPPGQLTKFSFVADTPVDKMELAKILRACYVSSTVPKGVPLGGVEIIPKKKEGKQSK